MVSCSKKQLRNPSSKSEKLHPNSVTLLRFKGVGKTFTKITKTGKDKTWEETRRGKIFSRDGSAGGKIRPRKILIKETRSAERGKGEKKN